jgi:hypothetical protein
MPGNKDASARRPTEKKARRSGVKGIDLQRVPAKDASVDYRVIDDAKKKARRNAYPAGNAHARMRARRPLMVLAEMPRNASCIVYPRGYKSAAHRPMNPAYAQPLRGSGLAHT